MKALNPNTGNLEKVYVKALDSMPVGAEIDFDGQSSDIPVGWEQVANTTPQIVYSKTLQGAVSETYTFSQGLYLLTAHTNGANSCIMDVVCFNVGGFVTTRIKDDTQHSYKTITYSATDKTVTMNNLQYTCDYSIIKLSI